MENVSKELEQKIIELILKNNPIEAVALVKRELNMGLKESKNLVDKYIAIHKK